MDFTKVNSALRSRGFIPCHNHPEFRWVENQVKPHCDPCWETMGERDNQIYLILWSPAAEMVALYQAHSFFDLDN